MSKDSNFSLQLVPVDAVGTPLLCALSVVIDDETIWPIAGDPEHAVEIQIDDLFSFLVEFWNPLLLRQTYPFALTPERPSLLASDAAKHWASVPQEQVDEEASELDSFEEAHNLALAFGGLFDLPPLWLIRQGEHILCDTGKIFARLPFNLVLAELTRVGSQISAQLLAASADKWGRIVDAWSKRESASELSLVSWSASIEAEVAAKLIGDGLIQPPKNFAEAANDNDELLIAARFAGTLPTEQIVEILEVARRFDLHQAAALDRLSDKAISYFRGLEHLESFAEGELLANFIREQLEISPSDHIDVFDCVNQLGIEVLVEAIGPPTFDGLAIAGSRFGPGAFINRNGRRIRDHGSQDLRKDAGARVTLAHELCHLLIDRDHPLGAVEILRSRMPTSVESRARAFAGEFLLPSKAAAKHWDEAGSPTDRLPLQSVLQKLVDHFGVSFSVAAWKVQHGARWGLENQGREKFRQLEAMLDILAPYR